MKNTHKIAKKGACLSKLANKSILSYGFKNKEASKENYEETYRTELRRERDKILYTGGFRRLQDKTQVMAATLEGDHRTRLTHTLEVEQIAISIADALGLNKDLVSAIALGHDIGHTPFGHAVERKLDTLLQNYGGFNHSIQSISYLWEKYGESLSCEIYEGILMHDSDMFSIEKDKAIEQLKFSIYEDRKSKNRLSFVDYLEEYNFFNQFPTTLEAQAVIWADKIAYITHDLEDFINSDVYWSISKADGQSRKREKNLLSILSMMIYKEHNKYYSIYDFELRDLVRNLTSNLIITSAKELKKRKLKQSKIRKTTTERFKKKSKSQKKKKFAYLNSLIINFGKNFREQYYVLRKFLDDHYIFSPTVQQSDAKAQRIVSTLFQEFNNNYKLLPLKIRKKIDDTLLSVVKDRIPKNKANVDLDELKLEELEKIIHNSEEYSEIKKSVIARRVASYIATMTDSYAGNIFANLTTSKND